MSVEHDVIPTWRFEYLTRNNSPELTVVSRGPQARALLRKEGQFEAVGATPGVGLLIRVTHPSDGVGVLEVFRFKEDDGQALYSPNEKESEE